tara:strand:- start:770 stop:1144 length:375 start_codon:yes stop_codon:yes gene_type:complete
MNKEQLKESVSWKVELLLKDAHESGHNAALAADPQMIQAVDTITGKVYKPFPICGFASVIVKGLRGRVLGEFKKRGFEKHYRGGISLWISDYGQSYDMKTAYARAYSKVLNERGIKSWPESRLD